MWYCVSSSLLVQWHTSTEQKVRLMQDFSPIIISLVEQTALLLL